MGGFFDFPATNSSRHGGFFRFSSLLTLLTLDRHGGVFDFPRFDIGVLSDPDFCWSIVLLVLSRLFSAISGRSEPILYNKPYNYVYLFF